MKILSLFDGVSCGRLALERAGIPVEKYYASEIDKYAIQIAQKNYPDTIQIGDVTKINFADYADVDMVIGGSPCQDLSIAKQNREGLRGARSGLFWKFVEALEVIRPKYFLLENVASMRTEDRDAITATLKRIYPETECIMINSALLSAQQRKRYYWTNWHVEQPQDKGILLKDILENGTATDVENQDKILCKTVEKSQTLMARDYKGFGNQRMTGVAVPCALRTREDETGKYKRLETKADNKANSLTSVQTDSMVAEKIADVVSQISSRDFQLSFQNTGNIRPHKTDKKKTGIGEAPTIYSEQNKSGTLIASQPVYAHNIAPERIGTLEGRGKGQANRIYSAHAKSVCIGANGGGGGAKTGLYKVDLPDGDYIIRKLTPVECERLQTLPDGWTGGVSNTQRYKAIGNGWTVDVIAHILKGIK